MFLAYKEITHNKARYLLVVVTFVLISYLVFLSDRLGNRVSAEQSNRN